MPLALMILGFGLVFAGIFFAVGGLGAASAHGTAIKGVSIQGPSWLIMVGLGVGTIIFGAWQFEQKPGDVGAPKEEATVITVAEGRDEPYTYGDSIRLDDLWDSCAEGDWTDCDELYEVSPFGSEYEFFGATCGGIVPEPDGEYCAVENREVDE